MCSGHSPQGDLSKSIFFSCNSDCPPVLRFPVVSLQACSLQATASPTHPSLSGSWPSTLATRDSLWSSTPQTHRLLQNRFLPGNNIVISACMHQRLTYDYNLMTPSSSVFTSSCASQRKALFAIFFFLKAAAVCLSSGSWGPTHHLTCVDASQLGKGWLESASLSINIIYILLALLTVLTVPLLLLHCCGRRLCSSCPR